MKQKTSILLCEDHTIYREGVRSVLEREPDIAVVGETGEGGEAIYLAALLTPDVVLLNFSLHGMHASEITRCIREKDRNVRVLILGMYDDEDVARRCREAGASGYLLKSAPVPQLLHAVRSANSAHYLTPGVLTEWNHASPAPSSRKATPARSAVSPREREVLLHLAEGYTYKEIGARLHLSVKTVDSHKCNLMRKLNIQSRAGLIRFAIRQRFIDA